MLTRHISLEELSIAKEKLENDGFFILKSYIHPEKIEKLNSDVENYYNFNRKKKLSTAPVGMQKTIANDPIINNIHLFNEDIFNICTLGSHLEIYKQFLNDDYYGLIPKKYPNFILAQCNIRKGASSLDFHIDVRKNFTGSDTWSMQGILALDKRGRENGGLKVIPKSHLRGDFPDKNFNEDEIEFVDLNKGDMVIFHSNLFHGTTEPIKKNSATWGLLLTYRSWWCKPQFDFTRMIDNSRLARLTNQQKTILGYHSLPSSDPETSPSSRTGYD